MKRALSPCQIGKCEIKNRFVMTAANLNWCTGGFVTEKVIDFYRERARGQVGLIIAGAAGVDPVRVNQVGMMQIYDDCFLPPLERLAKQVHREGGKIFLQLMHTGAYARPKEHGGMQAVAPSAYFCRFSGAETKELAKEEVGRIIAYFKDGAIRARQAGFDGVELIGSAGYLIAEFLSKAVNRREDEYGGDIKGRAAFLLETVKAVKDGAGTDYPVIVRLSGADFIPGGNGPEDAREVARLLGRKVDAINVTGGWHESQVPQITYNVPRGMYLYLAKAVKDAASVPVIGCNRMDLYKAEDAIENGCCDMAGILRGLIADPFLIKKRIEGGQDAVRPCLSCNQCLEDIFSGRELRCAVNPYVGREMHPEQECFGKEMAQSQGSPQKEEIKQETEPGGIPGREKILVIGAGISGMAYASLMAKKGRVDVWEKSFRYGGAARAVAEVPYRENVKDFVDYLFRACILKGVRFCWNKEANAKDVGEALKTGQFDRVVIASGSSFRVPGYEISEDANVCTATDCLLSRRPKGRKIVVVGSNYKAVQTAHFCARAKKAGDKEQEFLSRYTPEYIDFANNVMEWRESSVTLLAHEKRAGGGFGKSTHWMMLKEIKQEGVIVETEAEVTRIEKGRVIYQKGGMEHTVPADLVVLAQGWEKDTTFWQEAEQFAGQVEIIGDAKRPGRISEAVMDAFRAAKISKEGKNV